jgi:hypothetical protein
LTEIFDIHAAFISIYGIGVEMDQCKNRMSKGMNRTCNRWRYEGDVRDEGIEWVIEEMG